MLPPAKPPKGGPGALGPNGASGLGMGGTWGVGSLAGVCSSHQNHRVFVIVGARTCQNHLVFFTFGPRPPKALDYSLLLANGPTETIEYSQVDCRNRYDIFSCPGFCRIAAVPLDPPVPHGGLPFGMGFEGGSPSDRSGGERGSPTSTPKCILWGDFDPEKSAAPKGAQWTTSGKSSIRSSKRPAPPWQFIRQGGGLRPLF